jgi:hypothetical protein
VGETAIAGVGGGGENRAPSFVVQRVVHPRQHPRGVAKGGMLGNVLDPLAVNPYLARIADALQEFLAVEGPLRLARTFFSLCLTGHPAPRFFPLYCGPPGSG